MARAPLHSTASLDLSAYQQSDNAFAHLSLHDLVEARALYHAHLARYPNVVATSIGRYRIRKGDSWPNEKQRRHGTGVRTLLNSEVRPYSWPCILVFVAAWETTTDFASRPSDMVPTTLFMPNGRRIPVCVIEAPREDRTATTAPPPAFPANNFGPGRPVYARVQGQTYMATVGCLVSDGHKIFALTNHHVAGDAGEPVLARAGADAKPIGTSAGRALGRLPLAALYPSLPDGDTIVNGDLGLIDIDEVARWTPKVPGIGIPGPMADYSDANLSLSLVGCRVRGIGAASGEMQGEIHGLFYRYKTVGGLEYVADLMIGPRTGDPRVHADGTSPFATHPGDSGTLWLLEPFPVDGDDGAHRLPEEAFRPLAVQWGRNMLQSAGAAGAQGYALATLLSRACALLEVDPVRDWTLDQPDTWGAVGHFSIATRSQVALSERYPKLVQLMAANVEIISRSDAALKEGDFKGMGSADFVPLADVPDFFWKPRVGHQGHTRPSEGPNHFADMDQKDANGETLLDLTANDAFIDPARWDAFYDGVRDLLTGEPIAKPHRGLLPFRVWQIYDAMVVHVAAGEAERFVCAAGVLTHYLGDACQPLHISYLHDGDPLRPVTHVFQKGKKAGQSERRPLGQGVHSAYEDDMVFLHRGEILDALAATPQAAATEHVTGGLEAAKRTIELMRATFAAVPPADIVETYIGIGSSGNAAAEALWDAYGNDTLDVMRAGAHLIAVLWESAWVAGGGEDAMPAPRTLREDEAMAIVADKDFLPSLTIDRIGDVLRPAADAA